MIKGVIFDMDGLMIDSEVVAERAWKKAILELKLEYDASFNSTLIGRNDKDVAEIIAKKYGSMDIAQRLQKRSFELVDEEFKNNGVPAKKGLFELIDYLVENKIKIAVASSNYREKIENNLKELGLLSKIDYISTGDEVERGKPDPEIFLKAWKGLGIEKSDLLILEDAVLGVEAAYRAEIDVIIVPDILPHPKESIDKSVCLLDNLIEVKEYIEKNKD